MARAGIYNLNADYGNEPDERFNQTDPYWIVAVIRLGAPLSYDRKTQSSSSKDLSSGALLRATHPLIMSDSVLRINVSNQKSSHTKTMTLTLKPDAVNYLVEILPDDWIFAWMVNNRDDYFSLLDRIDKAATTGDPTMVCNRFNDGLKFIGRVDDIYDDTLVIDAGGTKSTSYIVRATGFRELEAQLFYDYALAARDAGQGDFGWLARFGVSVDALFKENATRGLQVDNVNHIIPTLLDLVLGHGPARSGNIPIKAADGNISATPQLDHEAANDPGFSYLVPVSVGNLVGKTSWSKGIMSYADLLELWIGVQSYSQKAGKGMWVPDFDPNDKYTNRKRTNKALMGTYLPFMPDFANRPLWQIFQQYVNHAINEIYTALKVNQDGHIVPAIVFRQIPFTTDAFVPPTVEVEERANLDGVALEGPGLTTKRTETLSVNTTKFLDMPRWHIPAALVKRFHVGRSNATRTNFVHIYGTSSYLAQGGAPIQYQMLNNKPIRDDVDIMRSGIRPYMTTVDCWVDDTVGKAPTAWMSLIADWTIGSHLTLNGTIEMYGVQAPIAEGDNVSFEGVIYHVMGVEHSAQMDANGGNKVWMTTLSVTNGMRNTDNLNVINASTEKDVRQGLTPIYPGFDKSDNTLNHPGLTVEHGNQTSGGDGLRKASKDDFDDRDGKSSQLNPDDLKPTTLAGYADKAEVRQLNDMEDAAKDSDFKDIF